MAKRTKSAKLSLSPSVYHGRIMDEAEQPLRYRGGDVGKWQRRLRLKLRKLLGVPSVPASQRVALEVRTLWEREHELGTIAKIAFASEPAADCLAYVCIPKRAEPPYTFFICLQGHSSGMHNSIAASYDDETTPIDVPGDRDFALGCMRRGIAALCIEQRSFGYRREFVQSSVAAHGYCHDASMQAFMLGRTLMGERVFDVDRGIDYLARRGDADMKRIGLVGNSGGGTTTTYAAAVLPRVRFAMPSCAWATFRGWLMSINHCSCNYVPGLYPLCDMADVLGLFAPRPVVIVSGKDDSIFPVGSAREAFGDLKRIYRAAGAADSCHHVVGPEGHRFYADLAWPVMLKELARG